MVVGLALAPMPRWLLLHLAVAGGVGVPPPARSRAQPYRPPAPQQPLVLPPWPPTYELGLSTALFPTNQSGWWNTSLTARFGLLNFDWSNAQAVWAAASWVAFQSGLPPPLMCPATRSSGCSG